MRNRNRPAGSGKKSHKWLIVLAIIFVIALIIYIFLPTWLLHYSNKKLSGMKEYYGHIESINIGLFKGTYRINSMHLDIIDTASNDTIPLFKVQYVSMNLNWGMLFKGKLLAGVYIDRPQLIFTNKKKLKEEAKEMADTVSVKETLSGLTPFTISQIEINDGTIHYIDENVTPALDLKVEKFNMIANNLTNIDKNKALPSELNITAYIYEGKMETNAFFNLLKDYPTFDLKMKINELNLVKMNKFLKEYAKFDIKSGKFNLTSEFAAKNGSYEGYVKPFIKDFEVNEENNENESTLKKVWEKVVDKSMDILENKKTDKVASRVTVTGRFDNTNISIWEAISMVLTNAFVEALKPGFENTVNLSDIGGNSEKEKKKDEK